MKVEMRFYDSQKDSTHRQIGWMAGRVHRMYFDGKVFYTGWYCYTYGDKCVAYDKNLEIMMEDAPEKWFPIELSSIVMLCQEDLAKQIGFSRFPWEESTWGSLEAYQEWFSPKKLENKVIKALEDSLYYTLWSDTEDYRRVVEDEYTLHGYNNFNKMYHKINGIWYLVTRTLSGKVLESSNIDVEQVRAEEEATKQAERKAYADKCGVISRRFGIRFEVVLKQFKGNAGAVELFAATLKDALGKPYNESELMAGRMRRRDEIARLGIYISTVDPNYIAPYILECLKAGKVLAR